MKTLLRAEALSSLTLIWLALIPIAGVAGAQEEERRGGDTIIVNDLDLNLAVPNSPALVVLGLNIDTVVRPTSPKELAAAVQNGLDRNGNFQSGAAVDFNPWMVFNGLRDTDASIQLSEYLRGDATLWPRKLLDNRKRGTNLWRNLWYRSQISFATTKGVTDDDDSVRVALGAKITPFDNGDPLLLTGKCIRAKVERLENFSTSLVDPLDLREGGRAEPLMSQLDQAIRTYGERAAHRGSETDAVNTVKELRSKIALLPVERKAPASVMSPNERVLALTYRLKKKFRLEEHERQQVMIRHGLMSPERLEDLKQSEQVDLVSPADMDNLVQQYREWRDLYDKAVEDGKTAAEEELAERAGLSPEERAQVLSTEAERSMQRVVDDLAYKIERDCKDDASKNDAWNRSAWDIAFAPSWFGEDGAFDSLEWNGGAVWTSLAFGWDTFVASDDNTDEKGATDPGNRAEGLIRNWSHFIVHARYRFDENQATSNLDNPPDDFFKADSWLVGGRARFGGPKFSLSFEGAYVHQNSQTAGVEDDTLYRFSIIPSFTYRGVTLEATFGTDSGRKGGDPAFVLSSIKWSLPSPNSP